MQTLTTNAVRAVGPPSTRQCQPSKNASLVACRAGKADGPVEAAKKLALVAGAAVLLMSEPSAALAATAKATKSTVTQGATFELVAGSKVKPIVGKASAEKAVYGAQKKAAAPAKKAAAPAKKAAAPAKKAAFKAAPAAPVKFGAVKGASQGTAPAGVVLPTPKGAVVKKVTAKPKPAAAKPKPAAAQKAGNPLAKKKAAAAGVAATAAAVVVEAPAAPAAEAPAPAPVKPKVKNYVKNTPAVKAAPAPKKASSSGPSVSFSFGGDAAEAGAVAAAEVVGVAVASSIVNGILAAPRAAKRSA